MFSLVGRIPTDEERALLATIDDPNWLGALVEVIRWLRAPWELVRLASKLTPELISRMPSDNAAEWYNYLSHQYTLILGLPVSVPLLNRAWNLLVRYTAAKFDKPIQLLWDRSLQDSELTVRERFSFTQEEERITLISAARGA